MHDKKFEEIWERRNIRKITLGKLPANVTLYGEKVKAFLLRLGMMHR